MLRDMAEPKLLLLAHQGYNTYFRMTGFSLDPVTTLHFYLTWLSNGRSYRQAMLSKSCFPHISQSGRVDHKGRGCLMLQRNLIYQTTQRLNASLGGVRGTGGVALPTSNCCNPEPITSCRFVLSSGPTACLYCHFSGTKGHFISFASWIRVLNSLGSEAEKVRVQVRKLQSKKRLLSYQCYDEAPQWQKNNFSYLLLAGLKLVVLTQRIIAQSYLSGVALLDFALQVNWGSQALRKVFSRK